MFHSSVTGLSVVHSLNELTLYVPRQNIHPIKAIIAGGYEFKLVAYITYIRSELRIIYINILDDQLLQDNISTPQDSE